MRDIGCQVIKVPAALLLSSPLIQWWIYCAPVGTLRFLPFALVIQRIFLLVGLLLLVTYCDFHRGPVSEPVSKGSAMAIDIIQRGAALKDI
jgi:hypothetical protein